MPAIQTKVAILDIPRHFDFVLGFIGILNFWNKKLEVKLGSYCTELPDTENREREKQSPLC